MPRGNGTGPTGMGPMTGRAAGYCAGNDMPGYENSAPEFGRGMRYGQKRRAGGPGLRPGGFSRRNRFYATGLPGRARGGLGNMSVSAPDSGVEKQALKSQAEYLQSQLDVIKNRLDELNIQGGDQ